MTDNIANIGNDPKPELQPGFVHAAQLGDSAQAEPISATPRARGLTSSIQHIDELGAWEKPEPNPQTDVPKTASFPSGTEIPVRFLENEKTEQSVLNLTEAAKQLGMTPSETGNQLFESKVVEMPINDDEAIREEFQKLLKRGKMRPVAKSVSPVNFLLGNWAPKDRPKLPGYKY